jgi:hypothetical protein
MGDLAVGGCVKPGARIAGAANATRHWVEAMRVLLIEGDTAGIATLFGLP